MNDFEERLARALQGAADRAPDPAPELSSGAKGHHGHRVALLAAAAAVLAVAIPAGVVALVQRDATTTPPISTQSSTPTSPTPDPTPVVPAGWRVETWHSVTLLVPDSWGYGDIHGCWDDGPPRVERPDGASRACLREGWGYGVAFLPRGTGVITVEPVDPDATLHMVSTNSANVVVITPDKETNDAIVASVRNLDEFDPNGCPVKATVPRLGEASATSAKDLAGSASLCRYSLNPRGSQQGDLVQSEWLGTARSRALDQAVAAAPEGSGPDASSDTCLDWREDEAVLILRAASRTWVHYSGCARHGVDLGGGVTRQLTSDVMYWALMPGWSGGVDGSVPLPRPLRSN